MSRTTSSPFWHQRVLAGQHFQLLNIDHPEVDACILGDMEAGVAVTYDRHWDVTTRFSRFLLTQPAWVADRTVLVLGAGVGLETLVIGRLCKHLYLNDFAPRALDLCARQLQRNGITAFTCLPGRYETLPLPPVDLIIGCYIVYSRDTAAAMRQFLARHTPPVLLVNEPLLSWHGLLREAPRAPQRLSPPTDFPCVLFDAASTPPAPSAGPAQQRRSGRRWRKP